MKQISTFILFILIANSLSAQNFILKKQKQSNKYDIIKNKYPLLNHNTFLQNVPTTIKRSFWNGSTWIPNTATNYIYSNNLKYKVVDYDYNKTDTTNLIEYTYNSDKAMTSLVYSTKYDSKLVPVFRYNLNHFNNYLKTITYIENFDTTNKIWEFTGKVTEEKDDKGNDSKLIIEYYENGNWILEAGYVSKKTYLNTSTNKYLERVDSVVDESTNQLVPDSKETRIYNNNDEAKIVFYYVNTNGWELKDKDSLFYSNSVLDSILKYSYSSFDQKYLLESKLDSFEWRDFNPLIDFYDNIPNTYINSKWINNNKYQKSYRFRTEFPDNFGSENLIDDYYINNNWVPFYRFRDVFDSHKSYVEHTEDLFDTLTNTWVTDIGNKNILTYDANNLITTEISQYIDRQNPNQFTNNGKNEYFDYISIEIGINTYKNTLETKLYPNPTSNGIVSINLNLEKESSINIDVIDLNGKIISTQKQHYAQGLNTIQLDGLTQGLYFVVISSEYGVSRTKLIVK